MSPRHFVYIYLARHVTLGPSCHDTTRHAISPMHFGTGKSLDMMCRTCRAARWDTHLTTSATRVYCFGSCITL